MSPELTDRLEAASATLTSAIHDADAGSHRSPRRRAGDIPDRTARRGQRGTVGDRDHQRRQGGGGARRSGCGAERDIRYRVADPDVVRPRDPRSHRRGLARSRRQPGFAASRAAGGPAVGRRLAAQPGVRTVDDGADVGDADARRILRRDGRGVGPDRTGRKHRSTRRGVASTSDRRSSTPRRESSTSPPTCRRRAATAPARPSS